MSFWSKLLGLDPQKLPFSANDANFEREILGSPLPVVLDVWSPGCVPCKQLEPIMLSLMERYEGRVRVAELNVAAAPHAAKRLGIRGTPTVVYLKDRREIERVVGLRGELYHQQTIDAVLLG
jgi:thioredoxin-like negative regulator of GroEL